MGLIDKLIDKRIAQYQNEIIAKHYEEVQNIYKEMRGWRHDYHNHIQTMKAYIALSQTDKLDAYLDRLDADLGAVDTVVKTGNIMVDAILNSKLSLAKSHGIIINAKATIPDEISIIDIDLCVIIGNLLDNAIEACMKVENPAGRFIQIGRAHV